MNKGLLEVLHGRPGASGAPKAHDPQARWSWINTHSRMKPTGATQDNQMSSNKVTITGCPTCGNRA